jgi:hypothetical protein
VRDESAIMPRMVRSRRRLSLLALLLVAVAAAAVILLAVGRDEDAPVATKPKPGASPSQRFHSRPDLRPPAMTVTARSDDATPGFVFLAPKRRSGQGGPAILDEDGKLVWFRPTKRGIVADDLSVQRYRGQPVLTWWEGRTVPKRGYGSGSWVIADRSYRQIARVRAGHGLHADLHEMQLTPRGTALIGIYTPVDANLAEVNAPAGGKAMDSVIQEVDVRTGKVLWEWHSIDHVALGESYVNAPRDRKIPMDYFHINSIDEDANGDLLVSARNAWALYKIDKRSGDVVWRLGGKRSDFALGPGVRFAWQHDARWQPDGTITLFDNESTPKIRDETRILTLAVDEPKRRVRLERALTHPDHVLSDAEGNAQTLPGGAVMVGWGLGRRVSEFGPDGKLRFDVKLPGDTDTYRGYRFPWTGRPAKRPVAAAERDGDHVTVYASWNGATEVTRWQLLAGSSPRALRPVASAPRAGFETAIEADTEAPFLAVRAFSGARALSTSKAIRAG